MAGCSALDEIYLDLIRYLNVSSLKPYLKQKQLLTDEESERLDFVSSQTSQSAIETLVKIVKRKGPSHETDFLSALKDSMKFDPHQGHVTVISVLEKVLLNQQDLLVESSITKSTTDPTHESEPHKKAALRSKVVKANNDIKIKFTKLVLDVYRIVSKKKVAVEEIRLGLLYLGCFKNSTETKCQQFPIIGPSGELSHTETVQSLIACLHQYSSWYNYSLIKFVATEFGGEEGAIVMDDYVKNLTSYCEKIVAFQCPEFSLANGLPPGYDQLLVKVDWDHISCTVQDVAIFQAELSSLLGLEPEVFILRSVAEGCVLVTWAVPQSITTHVVIESMRHQQALAKLNVLYIISAGKCIDIKKVKHDDIIQTPVDSVSRISDSSGTSQSSSLSDFTDASTLPSPISILPGYDTTKMTADEIEIVSTYSGQSRSSVYSTESHGNSVADLAQVKLFHSELDIISQDSLQIRASRRNSLPGVDKKCGKKQRAKKLLKSILPKGLKERITGSSADSEASLPDRCEKTQEEECNHNSTTLSHFPILNLSEEPAIIRKEGKQACFHYYTDDTNSKEMVSSVSTPIGTNMKTVTPGAIDIEVFDERSNRDSTVTPMPLESLNKHTDCPDITGGHCSESDLESGLGSTDTFPEDIPQLGSNHVQRSQSMKYPSSMPRMDLSSSQKCGGLSLPKLSENNISTSLQHESSLVSYDRGDTPSSSGYGESHSGCCSMVSSQYSLGSGSYNLPMDMPAMPPVGSDFLHQSERLHYSSSLKRGSITMGVKAPKEPVKSGRSHSFNGIFTIHHNSTGT